jgi:hypothetical protein
MGNISTGDTSQGDFNSCRGPVGKFLSSSAPLRKICPQIEFISSRNKTVMVFSHNIYCNDTRLMESLYSQLEIWVIRGLFDAQESRAHRLNYKFNNSNSKSDSQGGSSSNSRPLILWIFI